MNKYEQILLLEAQINGIQKVIDKLKYEKTENVSVKRGDYVICTRTVEWAYDKGERMWVDSVADGRIYCRSAKPENRKYGIFWVSNGDWIKDEPNEKEVFND